MLAVANALQLEALGVERHQKRARQATALDGPKAQTRRGGRSGREEGKVGGKTGVVKVAAIGVCRF